MSWIEDAGERDVSCCACADRVAKFRVAWASFDALIPDDGTTAGGPHTCDVDDGASGELSANAQPVGLVVEASAVQVQLPEHPPALDRAAATALARIIRRARDAARQDGAPRGGGG